MPVTIHPSSKPLAAVHKRPRNEKPAEKFPGTPHALLDSTNTFALLEKVGEVFQSSISNDSPEAESIHPPVDGNGFVGAALQAYNLHHHLIIRPDDIWITILTQFNLYVNANAEDLRHLFIAHEGKKSLVIKSGGDRYTADFGDMSAQMGSLIQENVVDPELREWFLPSFSTTTDNDRVVSSAVLMSTTKAYFQFVFELECGLPAVTLLGEKRDWEMLLTKSDQLAKYGEATAEFANFLRPVLTRFVSSFESPESSATKDFWQRIAHQESGGSGPTFLTGWITAFCFFDNDGKPTYWQPSKPSPEPAKGGKVKSFFRKTPRRSSTTNQGGLDLDGVRYPSFDAAKIPPAFVDVPVLLNDNGQEFNTLMIAGMTGVKILDSDMKTETHDGKADSLQPVPGWWIFDENKSPSKLPGYMTGTE